MKLTRKYLLNPQLLTIIIFATTINSSGQTNFDCKNILKTVPYCLTGSKTNPDSALIDVAIFRECGKLDSIDCDLVKLPTLGFILMKYPIKEKKGSYQSVLNSLNEYKKSEDYAKFREAMITYKTFESRKANINNWETDKQLLLKIGMKEGEEMERFKVFIGENNNKTWTYKEAMQAFEESVAKNNGGELMQGLVPFKKEGKYGYKDQTGKVIVEAKYDEAYDFIQGAAQVSLNNKSGLIDSTGKEIVALKYDFANAFSEELAQVSLNSKSGFVDKTGKEVIELKFDGLMDFSEGLAGAMQTVTLGNTPSLKYGFIDKTGKEVIPFKYEMIDSFSEGLAAVMINKKWGFIDKTGKLVIPSKYDYVGRFSEGIASVELNGNQINIDKTGKKVE